MTGAMYVNETKANKANEASNKCDVQHKYVKICSDRTIGKKMKRRVSVIDKILRNKRNWLWQKKTGEGGWESDKIDLSRAGDDEV